MVFERTMGDTMKWIIAILVLVAIMTAIGLNIERSRRRKLLAFAQEHRGTFEPGSLMEGAPVPEAAPFDAPIVISSTGDDDDDGGDPPKSSSAITYRNVIRIAGDEASYVIARRSHQSESAKGESKTTSYLVCFVTLARSDLPQVEVSSAGVGSSDWMYEGMGALKPVRLELTDPLPGFAKELQVQTMPGAALPTPEALNLLLDHSVQAELVAQRNPISSLQVKGNVVRLQAVRTPGDESYRELYEAARKLAKIWAGK